MLSERNSWDGNTWQGFGQTITLNPANAILHPVEWLPRLLNPYAFIFEYEPDVFDKTPIILSILWDKDWDLFLLAEFTVLVSLVNELLNDDPQTVY